MSVAITHRMAHSSGVFSGLSSVGFPPKICSIDIIRTAAAAAAAADDDDDDERERPNGQLHKSVMGEEVDGM